MSARRSRWQEPVAIGEDQQNINNVSLYQELQPMLENDQTTPTPPYSGSFLSGPTLYLRGLELGDAASIASWYPSPFPAPNDVAEERLKEDVPGSAHRGTYRLIACRHNDDRPMGSVEFTADDGLTGWLSVHAAPLLGPDAGEVRAELLEIMVPWLQTEKDLVAIWVELAKGDTLAESAAVSLGMRFAYRFREGCLFNGRRTDLVCYEALHPKWIVRFGLPALTPEGEPIISPKYPTPRTWSGFAGTPPKNAISVGNRLYLRPIEQSDAEEIARWSVRESERSHDLSRHIRSPISDWIWNRRNAADDGQSWVRFSIVTIEDDIVIGSMGLADLDWISSSAESEIVISRPDYRGAGFGTESKHLLLEYAFDRLGLNMIKSYVWKFNQRSAAALANQGYRQAGGLSWTGMKDAEFVDDLAFDLLADEWREHRRIGSN